MNKVLGFCISWAITTIGATMIFAGLYTKMHPITAAFISILIHNILMGRAIWRTHWAKVKQ